MPYLKEITCIFHPDKGMFTPNQPKIHSIFTEAYKLCYLMPRFMSAKF